MASTIPVYPDLPETSYLRLPQVLRFIPVGRSTWWQGVKDGRFPQSVKLGPKTTVWKAEDICQLIKSLEKKATSEESNLVQSKMRNISKSPGKLDRIPAHFAQGESLNRFQAEGRGDHCLHSSISSLQNKSSTIFSRKWIKAHSLFGSTSNPRLYWLDNLNLRKAKELPVWEVKV